MTIVCDRKLVQELWVRMTSLPSRRRKAEQRVGTASSPPALRRVGQQVQQVVEGVHEEDVGEGELRRLVAEDQVVGGERGGVGKWWPGSTR